MQKIITLFQRNYETDHLVRDEVVPGAEWVLTGEGKATRKWDGTCCMVEDGKLYKRYDAKNGKQPPEGFIPAQEPDAITGHWPGWLPVGAGNDDKYHREAFAREKDIAGQRLQNGTYELIGPAINRNPEKVADHWLVRHGAVEIEADDAPRTFGALKEWFAGKDIEGIVWHYPDGRMVKIKKKDFGYKR